MSAFEPGSFLAELSADELADLEGRAHVRRWHRGAVLFREGETSTWVALLRSGRVKVTSHGENGVSVLLAVRGPGALLGEVAALDGQPRSANVITLEPVSGLMLTATGFRSFVHDHQRVSDLLMQIFCQRLRHDNRARVELGMLDATSRVAQRLVELADRYGVPYGDSVQITLNLTQEELAGWVGATREAVSKALRTLRTHGWIETGRRSVIVHDLPALRRRAQGLATGTPGGGSIRQGVASTASPTSSLSKGVRREK